MFIGFGVGVVGRVFGGCVLSCGYSLVVACGGDRGKAQKNTMGAGFLEV